MLTKSLINPLYFDRGNPFGEPAQEIIRKLINNKYHQYVDPFGLMELRVAISKTLFTDLAVLYNPDTEIIVTAGAASAIYCIMAALTTTDEQILLPDLGWPTYLLMTKMLHKNVDFYSLPINMHKISAAEWYAKITQCVTKRTKLLVLNYPHNPTGNMLNEEWLFYLVKLCEAYPKLLILSDETYYQIVFDCQKFISPAALAPLTKRVIVVRSFSKGYSMAGWRLGYIAAPQKLAMLIRPYHLAIHNYASSISQVVGIYALKKGNFYLQKLQQYYQKNRHDLMQILDRFNLFKYQAPQGTFYLFTKIIKFNLSAVKLTKLLADEEKIFVYPGLRYGKSGKDYIRICFAAPNHHIKQLAARLTHFIEKHNVPG